MALLPQATTFLILLLFSSSHATLDEDYDKQSEFFALMNESLTGDSMTHWWRGGKTAAVCDYRGVGCDGKGRVVKLDVSDWSLSGELPDDPCSYLPELRILRLGRNDFRGGFLPSIANCSFLEELNVSGAYLRGPLPDFSRLRALRSLDLSYNLFGGDFPVSSVMNLSNLEFLNINENTGFNPWEMPESISQLGKLKHAILMSCMLGGRIPSAIANLTSLVDLELSGNSLVGSIPPELGSLRSLELLELYYNQLEGDIPEALGNLTRLRDLDLSVNALTGKIPDSVCLLPRLDSLQLYNNSLSGDFPTSLANSTTLRILSLYTNRLTGVVPRNFGAFSALEALDLSENEISGELPPRLCSRGKLKYILLLQNKFSGTIPESYGGCWTLVRFRVNNNHLVGEIPEGILGLPHASIVDVSYNHMTGPISRTIANAKNLSQLLLQGNNISGTLVPEIGGAINLVKIDLSDNRLSGPIPREIGNLKRLNVLFLQGNELNSSIPDSLSSLPTLNDLDVSRNLLTGEIPASLVRLLPNTMNFSNNMLSGPIPIPFVKSGLRESFSGNPSLCLPEPFLNSSYTTSLSLCANTRHLAKRKRTTSLFWIIGISAMITLLGIALLVKQWRENQKERGTQSETSYEVKTFHRVSFEPREIFEGMVEKNIVGHGGSGTVYRVETSTGEAVAVKKVWNHRGKSHCREKQEDKEVETLGNIRHKNIVKLYCYYTSRESRLLVYEYMRNGNLWDALHRGKILIQWPTRYGIALGVAQGLAYLHHHLLRPIIHRDIKSTNILLDGDYLPKVADFGIAKVLQARGGKDSSSTTLVAGTYGYLAPECAYSSKASTKCDVYSFGVVLLELVTGKEPVDIEFGENKNIVQWISTKVGTKEEAFEVLDRRVPGAFVEDMMKVLRVAVHCTRRTPALRPTMNDVVQQLVEADPCKFRCCHFPTNKSKDLEDCHPAKGYGVCDGV